MKKKTLFIDYIFLLRPTIQVALWTFYFIGVYLGYREEGNIKFFNFVFNFRTYYILLAYSLLMGGVYILNQITDIETDRMNKKLFILPERIISVKNAYTTFIFVVLIGFFMIFFNFKIQKTILNLFIISFIMGYLYSAKPFYFKSRPFLDLFSNVFGYALIASMIGYLSVKNSFPQLIIFIPYMFSMAAIFINTTILDYEGDRKVGLKTTGILLGIKTSLFVSTFFMILALVSGIYNKDTLAIVTTSYSLIFFIISLFFRNEKYVKWSVMFTSPFVSFILGLIFPYFLLLCAFTLFLSLIYYKKRFNYNIL
ncbi:MAG: UbiA family prenyltransferase [candidate division WOR-3 bacterium]